MTSKRSTSRARRSNPPTTLTRHTSDQSNTTTEQPEKNQEEINYHRYKNKLEAEALIATSAALFAGLALTILDNGPSNTFELSLPIKNMTMSELTTVLFENTADDNHKEKLLIASLLLSYLRLILLGFTSVANLYVLTIATTTYFVGTRILAKTDRKYKDANERFVLFWSEFSKSRRLSRNLFVVSPPIFMMGVALGLLAHLPLPVFVLFVMATVGVARQGTLTARRMIASILPKKKKKREWWNFIRTLSGESK